jgi:hypothetical protein
VPTNEVMRWCGLLNHRNIKKKLHATNRTKVAYVAHRLFNGEVLTSAARER